MSKKINHLVVDTTAFIKAANLQDLAKNVYTIQEVIDEITNDRQRKKLVVLPYDLKVKNVFTENIVLVTEFAKKTGDYISLSATDIKVMALTYQLEKELVGTGHLKTAPTVQRFVKVTGIGKFKLHPDSIKNENTEIKQQNCDTENKEANATELEINVNKEDSNRNFNSAGEDKSKSPKDSKDSHEIDELNLVQSKQIELEVEKKEDIDESKSAEDIAKQMGSVDINDDDIDNVMERVSDEEEEEESDSEESDDEGEWITTSNLATKKKEMEMGEFEDKAVEVACITSDFAMQNVLKQIGLNVTAIDGRVIKQLRTFIFRCTTCFKTTSVMTKLFCPNCGHATLKKVGVSIDDDGNQHIHINGRKPLTARGKRFSLPTPKGGQHFQYPILTEDQHIHKRFATKMARNKTKALDPDYTAGFSPFVMKDVNSKSAVLGVRADKQDVKYWMKNYSKGKKK